MLPRQYHLIDTTDALDWQKDILERIHVHDVEGEKTLLYFSGKGNRIDGHMFHNFSVPIQYFDPQHAPELYEYLRSRNHYIAQMGDAELEQKIAAPSREYLQTIREEEYLYTLTPQEEMQIARIFVELNKYPEISSRVKEPATWVFTTDDTRSLSDASGHPEAGKGRAYYSMGDQTIVLGGDNTASIYHSHLRFAVAEETVHAHDARHGLSDEVMEVTPQDIEEAKQQAKKIQRLQGKKQFVGMERANITFSEKEERKLSMVDTYAGKLREYWKAAKHPAYEHGKSFLIHNPLYHGNTLLGLESKLQRDAAFFDTHQTYKDMPFSEHQAEFFGKTLSLMALRRHFTKHMDQSVRRAFEVEMYETPYQKKLLAYLDELTEHYRSSHSPEALEKADAMIEKLVVDIERKRPGITVYSLRNYGQEGPAR